jgi:hypothetical protein
MENITTLGTALACALATLFTASAARAQVTTDAVPAAASFTSGGYTQNFDSMGTTGTVTPAGWGTYSEAGSHDTFSPIGNPNGTGASPTPNGGTSNSAETGSLTAATITVSSGTTNPKSTGAYNIGTSLGNPLSSSSDRALGTSPSGNAATVLELTLTNNTSAAINAVSLQYDIDRFTTTEADNTAYNSSPTVGVEENPGYWLYYSLNGGTNWTNVSALNPTLSGTSGVVVPNSLGVTTATDSSLGLSSAWGVGSNIEFAWVDDNAQSPSPDQIIGLNNVSIAAVPEPGAGVLGLVAMGVAFTLVRLRRQRA